jgi:hypothetical protein
LKFVLWALVLYFAWRLYQSSLKAKPHEAEHPAESEADVATPFSQKPAEKMLACAECGVLIPESEALSRHALAFCCEEHSSRHNKP